MKKIVKELSTTKLIEQMIDQEKTLRKFERKEPDFVEKVVVYDHCIARLTALLSFINENRLKE